MAICDLNDGRSTKSIDQSSSVSGESGPRTLRTESNGQQNVRVNRKAISLNDEPIFLAEQRNLALLADESTGEIISS
jgi:hypothetical protein